MPVIHSQQLHRLTLSLCKWSSHNSQLWMGKGLLGSSHLPLNYQKLTDPHSGDAQDLVVYEQKSPLTTKPMITPMNLLKLTGTQNQTKSQDCGKDLRKVVSGRGGMEKKMW